MLFRRQAGRGRCTGHADRAAGARGGDPPRRPALRERRQAAQGSGRRRQRTRARARGRLRALLREDPRYLRRRALACPAAQTRRHGRQHAERRGQRPQDARSGRGRDRRRGLRGGLDAGPRPPASCRARRLGGRRVRRGPSAQRPRSGRVGIVRARRRALQAGRRRAQRTLDQAGDELRVQRDVGSGPLALRAAGGARRHPGGRARPGRRVRGGGESRRRAARRRRQPLPGGDEAGPGDGAGDLVHRAGSRAGPAYRDRFAQRLRGRAR